MSAIARFFCPQCEARFATSSGMAKVSGGVMCMKCHIPMVEEAPALSPTPVNSNGFTRIPISEVRTGHLARCGDREFLVAEVFRDAGDLVYSVRLANWADPLLRYQLEWLGFEFWRKVPAPIAPWDSTFSVGNSTEFSLPKRFRNQHVRCRVEVVGSPPRSHEVEIATVDVEFEGDASPAATFKVTLPGMWMPGTRLRIEEIGPAVEDGS